MNSRRTWGIDLTPLLDILFILLFMIMLRSVQYADAKVQEAEQRAKEAESRVQVVEEHLDKAYEVIGEYDILLKDTLTVRIEIQADTEEGEGARVLSFRAGSMSESFHFGWNTASDLSDCEQFLKDHLQTKVNDASAEAPAFLIFSYNPDDIYKSEYQMISGVLENLQQKNENVYLQYREIITETEPETTPEA